jgi:hypothetical protein
MLCRIAPAFFGKKGGSVCPVAWMVYLSMIEVGATSLSVRDFVGGRGRVSKSSAWWDTC